MILALVATPLVCALATLLVGRRAALWVNAFGALGALAIACALTARVLGGGAAPTAAGGLLRADDLAVFMAVVVTAAAAVAAFAGLCDLDADVPEEQARRYALLASALVSALLCTVLADDLGVMWITMELSAVLSAFLVGFRGGAPALEAAFKYMLLGSAGLVLGLLATAVVHRAGVPVLGHGDAALSFQRLHAAGPRLSAHTLRIALALAAAGYGLKVGLFPLHVWKPDAYAAAPAPVTAVLAGAAVAVPLAAIVRFGALASAAGEGAFASRLFVTGGLVSIVAALVLVAGERDLRRILAFTSVEHMGLVLLAVGLDPDSVRGGLYHLLTNGTLKALAFGLCGLVVRARGGADTLSGPGLYGRSFVLAGAFLAAMSAALGFPPFGMFASELAVLRALFVHGHVALAMIVTLSLAAIFGVVATATLRIVFARSDEAAPTSAGDGGGSRAVALAVPVLAAMTWIGVGMPAGIWARLYVVAQRFAP
jgi:hydrogenase-4 component F